MSNLITSARIRESPDEIYDISCSVEELELSKDSKLEKIAQAKGIHVPSNDIAIFKCVYGVTDKKNANGAIFPKDEVEKALHTINGKAVDIDHLRRYTVGYFFHAELEDSKIIAYGVFWKNNYSKEYTEFKDKMSEGKVKISLEAWRDKELIDSSSHICRNIEFAGGAILNTERPAESLAELLEMANKEMKDNLEKSRFYAYELDMINQLIWKVDLGENKWINDILSIDFENSLVRVKSNDDNIYVVTLTPKIKLEKSNYIVEKVEVEPKIEVVDSDKSKKEDLNKGEKSMDLEKRIAELEAELARLKTEVNEKDAEIAAKNAVVDELKKSSDELSSKVAEIQALTIQKVEEAKVNAKTVAERRVELTTFAESLTDEQILDEKEYALAKKDKEIAELKVKLETKVETASTKTELVTGTLETSTKKPELSQAFKEAEIIAQRLKTRK